MADTIIDNINSIIRTKSELKSVLTENGQNPSDTFSEYPDMFRSAIQAASENGANEEIVNAYISAYLSAYNFIDQDALSANSYLTSVPSEFITQDELSAMGYLTSVPEVDLSSYVTYSYADNKYFGRLTGISGLSDGNVISSIGESFDAGASVRGIYYQKTYVPSYAYIESYYTTKSELSSAGYITSGDVAQMGYLTSSDLPVIDENLIPKETNTYTLGDASHLYAASYVSDMWTSGKNRISNRSDNQINIQLNNGWKYTFHSNGLSPATQSQDLGNGTPWRSTYTTNLYTDTAYLQDTSYSSSIVPKETNTYGLGSFDNPWAFTYSYQLNVGNNSKIYNDSGGVTVSINANNGVRFGTSAVYPKTSGGFSLGSSSNRWAYTYTNNLILNGTDIKDTINGMFSYDSTTGILTITSLT